MRSRPLVVPPPVVLVLVGITTLQVGAAVAKTLFDDVGPTALVWLRLGVSALVLLAVTRPRVRGLDRQAWLAVAGFGGCLAVMNWAIYQSFARIPLGIAVTIEFVGPLTVALLGSRRARDLVWAGLAALGVVLLGAERADLDLVGVLLAALAAVMWAAYILLSGAVGRRLEGLDGLALASAVAAVLLAPGLLVADSAGLADPRVLLLGALVAVMSSVVPYSCELVALRTMSPAVFGILMSLEPAAAALAGIVVVGETLQPLQWLAVGCVVVASIGATRRAAAAVAPVPD